MKNENLPLLESLDFLVLDNLGKLQVFEDFG